MPTDRSPVVSRQSPVTAVNSATAVAVTGDRSPKTGDVFAVAGNRRPATGDAVLKLGTRGSPLALWQARWALSRLTAVDPKRNIELVTLVTSGDRLPGDLSQLGGKGLFIKELDDALLSQRIDLAVHSLKDIPGELAPGIAIAAYSARAEAGDLLITRDGVALADLPHGARVGTSSPRRRWQLLALRPDLEMISVRGNVGTRLRFVADRQLDAVVLASAGVSRLELRTPQMVELSFDDMLPAIGQGTMVVATRANDAAAAALVATACNDADNAICMRAERALLQAIGGDCTTPLAGMATHDGTTLSLRAFLASADGSRHARAVLQGDAQTPEAIGRAVAGELMYGL